jgi:ribosome-binding protein aMBF1 (putative translation factor)
MSMCIDVQCRCGIRFGWAGTMRNRPPCPSCGDRPTQEKLDAMADQMEADRKLLDTHPGKATADERRRQRVAAGLTLRQAAKKFGIFPSDLSEYEQGTMTPSEALLEQMAEVYGVGR